MKKILILFILMMSNIVYSSNEIQFPYSSADDPNLYCIISRTTDGKVWDAANGVWSAWTDVNEPNYALDLVFDHKDFYKTSFPAGITTAGMYPFIIYKWEGAEPNVTDDSRVGQDEMPWDGSAEITTYTTYADINEIKDDVNEIPDIPTAAENRDAVFAKTGITAGGTWTFAKIMEIIAAWIAGNWQESGDPNVYEVLDAENGSTVIMDVNITDLKRVTVP